MDTYHEAEPHVEDAEGGAERSGPALVVCVGNQEGEGVRQGLENHDTAKPPVQEVERVERDVQPLDQGVVAAGQDEQGNLEDGQRAPRLSVPRSILPY